MCPFSAKRIAATLEHTMTDARTCYPSSPPHDQPACNPIVEPEQVTNDQEEHHAKHACHNGESSAHSHECCGKSCERGQSNGQCRNSSQKQNARPTLPSQPLKIRRLTTGTVPETQVGVGLSIDWSDGSTTILNSNVLRRACPCATCIEKRATVQGNKSNPSLPTSTAPKKSRLTVIKSSEQEETDLVTIRSIGNYAIGLRWRDGHDSGIYTYSYLFELQALNV